MCPHKDLGAFQSLAPRISVASIVATAGNASSVGPPPAVLNAAGGVANQGAFLSIVPGPTSSANEVPVHPPAKPGTFSTKPMARHAREDRKLVRLVIEVDRSAAPSGANPREIIRQELVSELSGLSARPGTKWPIPLTRGQGSLMASVEPLFPGADDLSEDPWGLSNYFVLTLPITIGSARGRRYDMAYRLTSNPLFRNVSVEGFFKRFVPLGGFLNQESPPGDMAWHLRVTNVPQAASLAPQPGGEKDGKGITIAMPDTGWLPHPQISGSVDVAKQFNTLGIENDPPRWESPRDATDRGTWLDLFHGHGTATASVLVSPGKIVDVKGAVGRGSPRSGLSNMGTDVDSKAFLVSPDADVVGAAPSAKVMPIRCVDAVVLVGDIEVSRAVWWAIRQAAEVCSMSIGGYPAAHLEAVISHAVHVENMVVCAAAGNVVPWVVYPAGYTDCIAVAGSSFTGEPWDQSSRGPQVAISAPAEDLWVAHINGADFVVKPGKGTSYATPQVAAAAARWMAHHTRDALLKIYAGSVPIAEVFRSLLQSTAQNTRSTEPWNKSEYGAGVLDVKALISADLPPVSNFPPANTIQHISTGAMNIIYAVMYGWDPADIDKFLDKLLQGWGQTVEEAFDKVGIELVHLLLNSDALDASVISDPTQMADNVTAGLRKVGEDISSTLHKFLGW